METCDAGAITAACGVLVSNQDGLRHHTTAWSVHPGEWLSLWPADAPAPDGLHLLLARDGSVAPIEGWEAADDGLVGFRSQAAERSLALDDTGSLAKRQPLLVVGYPSVIDHPAINLHRGGLDPTHYHPYLCPWIVHGHLALFAAERGWLAGAGYPGMEGAPVLTADGHVVGVVDGYGGGVEQPPLVSFRRLRTAS